MDDLAAAAGAVIVAGIPGPELDAATCAQLTRIQPGMVVLFARNVAGPEHLRRLTDALHALPWRPLVAIDHEGGGVSRLAPPYTAFPGAAELARTDPDTARAVGAAIGRELADAGIDVDFAPVLDVRDATTFPALAVRSFGSDPRIVAAFGLAFAAGLRDSGIVACAKHFPGQGGTAVDTHRGGAVMARDRAALEAVDLVPFRAAAADGLPMVMTGHVRVPALDADAIASCSAPIITGLLREALGYDGAVVTDDLCMVAARDWQVPPKAALRALAAGADAVMICHDLAIAETVAGAIAGAVQRGTLPRSRLDAAAARMRRLRPTAAPPPPALTLPVSAHAALAARVRAMAAAADAC